MKEKVRFLGLDVHAETIAVAVAEPEGEVRSLGTIPNRAESIRKLIKKLGPTAKLRACYEAGPTGNVVYWQLAEHDTKLVTVTVGGNDVGYIGNLVSGACLNDPKIVPLFARLLGVCRIMPKSEVQRAVTRLPLQLAAIVDQIRTQAPEARVVFIGYATVLPDSGTCPQLHLTAEQADAGRTIGRELEEITERAAAASNLYFVNASSLTHGHDVCSHDPWVNGFVFPATPFDFGPAAFHPTERAMRVIAETL